MNRKPFYITTPNPFDKENVKIKYYDKTPESYKIYIADSSPNIFDKKIIKIKYVKNHHPNASIVSSFPNYLLLSDDKEIRKTSKNIWDVYEKISKKYNSESLEDLTSDKPHKTNSSDSKDKGPEKEIIDDLIPKTPDKHTEKFSQSDEENETKRKCEGCGKKGTIIEDHKTGTLVCDNCGMVIEEILDLGPEWRQYTNDDSHSNNVNRCGCPSNYFFPKSSQGTIIIGRINNRIKRKQKWNSMIYKERSLNQVFEFIDGITSKHKIPKIITDTAKILYKQISDSKHQAGPNMGKQIIIRGENRVSIIAACLYKACEMNKNPYNIKEISEIFHLSEKKITKGIKHFYKIIKNTEDKDVILDQIEPNTAEDHIRRHCVYSGNHKTTSSKIKISKTNMELAIRMANNCSKMKLASDHNPESIAAGIIYLMCQYTNLSLDKKTIANCFGTSDVTIGKLYNKMRPYLEALVDDDLTNHLIKKLKING